MVLTRQSKMKLFREGQTEFYAPEGDITKKMPVFYNPVMQFDRDLTVAVLKAFSPKNYCDLLAASGIRGVRASKEASVKEIYINDLNPSAIKLAEKNCKKNKVKAEVSCKEANLFLRGFDYGNLYAIDIDPFGPFIPFLESSLRVINSRKGLLCLTATDTAPLCGVAVKACQRRYDARPARTSYAKEIGLRILIGACARMAARFEFALKPLLCYNHRHYFRLYLATEGGVKTADSMLANISYLQFCHKCDWREYAKVDRFKEKCPVCDNKLEWAGPLWSAEFADVGFLAKVKTENKEVSKLVELLKKEQAITTPFYEVAHLSEIYRTSTPRKQAIMDVITAKGHKAAETHFSGTGIRSEIIPQFHV